MLSTMVITFLPRSKRILIPWLQSPSAEILEPKKIKSGLKDSFETNKHALSDLGYRVIQT